nr:uncharacterized protein LOC117995287 [Maniola hyperantus]
MHWACKRGDENLVKLLAGIHRHIVNERSNGGYTPLHIAMQFRHENVYRLLVEVYDADPNVRDWSGKKPRQYLVHMDTSLSPGSYRKKEGFLRIGSLNVRVKKTTEAFSNFLGVGATRASAYVPKSVRDRELERRSDDSDQLKSWGSADNIQAHANCGMELPSTEFPLDYNMGLKPLFLRIASLWSSQVISSNTKPNH